MPPPRKYDHDTQGCKVPDSESRTHQCKISFSHSFRPSLSYHYLLVQFHTEMLMPIFLTLALWLGLSAANVRAIDLGAKPASEDSQDAIARSSLLEARGTASNHSCSRAVRSSFSLPCFQYIILVDAYLSCITSVCYSPKSSLVEFTPRVLPFMPLLNSRSGQCSKQKFSHTASFVLGMQPTSPPQSA